MKQKTSPIWNYFVAIDNSKARCELCDKVYSRKGRTTTALKSHLKAMHIEEFAKFEKLNEAVKLSSETKNEKIYSHKISVKPEPTETVQFSNPEDVYLVESNCYSDSEEFEEEEPLRKRSRNSSSASRRIEESHEGGSHDLAQTLKESHEGGSHNFARMMDSHEGGSHDLGQTMKESHESSSHYLARMMKDISCHLHVLTNQSQDCFDSFGRYVSAMLRGMPARRAVEVQPQIVSLLVAATLKSEDKETIT